MRTMEEMAQWLKDSYEERKIRYTHSYGKAYKVDKNGTLYFANHTCKRCGGAGGADQWAYTGWTCYECGGSGISSHPDTVKLMLPEYEIKLEERRAKRYAKKQAEHNAKIAEIRKQWLLNHNWTEDGFTYIFLGNTYEMKESIKAVGGTFNHIMGWFINHEVEGFQMLKVSMDGVLCETYDGYDYIVDAPIATMKKEAERKSSVSIMDTIDGMCLSMPKNAVVIILAASITMAVFWLGYFTYQGFEIFSSICGVFNPYDPYFLAENVYIVVKFAVIGAYFAAIYLCFKSGDNEKNGYFLIAIALAHVIAAVDYEIQFSIVMVLSIVVWAFCLRRVYIMKKEGGVSNGRNR